MNLRISKIFKRKELIKFTILYAIRFFQDNNEKLLIADLYRILYLFHRIGIINVEENDFIIRKGKLKSRTIKSLLHSLISCGLIDKEGVRLSTKLTEVEIIKGLYFLNSINKLKILNRFNKLLGFLKSLSYGDRLRLSKYTFMHFDEDKITNENIKYLQNITETNEQECLLNLNTLLMHTVINDFADEMHSMLSLKNIGYPIILVEERKETFLTKIINTIKRLLGFYKNEN